jgi:hypothetical protein
LFYVDTDITGGIRRLKKYAGRQPGASAARPAAAHLSKRKS